MSAADMPSPLLQVSDLSVQFRGASTPALSQVSFEIGSGEGLAILGESGAGKSTLARAIVGLLDAGSTSVQGSVLFEGNDLLRSSRHDLRRIRGSRACLIAQDPELALHPFKRIQDQLSDVLRAHAKIGKEECRRRLNWALETAGFPTRLSHAHPHELSGGLRQRVLIAQALIGKPALLIADEPTSALDTVLQREILLEFRRLMQTLRLALIFITHDPLLIPGLAERVLVLRNGCVVETGRFEATIVNPRQPYTSKLVSSIVPLPARELRPAAAVQAFSGCEEQSGSTSNSSAGALLQVRNLSRTYTSRRAWSKIGTTTRALDQVSFTLASGSAISIVGKSGSGKSTLARCVALLEKPDTGEIRLRGESMTKLSQRALRHHRRQTQMVWQHSALALNPRLRVIDLIAEPLRIVRSPLRAESYDRAIEMMGRLDLGTDLRNRSPLELSGGQRQRVALARALVCGPSILVLDEVFAGLDLPLQSEITAMLLELKVSLQLAYVLITHDLRRAMSFAGRILVMEDGKIVEEGEPSQIFWTPRHSATQELVSAVANT